MATLVTIRTARKLRQCETESHACRREIRPGEKYRRATLTPNDPDIGNVGWWSLDECTACAALYGRPVVGGGA